METSKFLFTTILSATITLSMSQATFASEPNYHDVVHDKSGQVIRNTFGNCVRTKWESNIDECQGTKRQIAQVQKIERYQIPDEERTIYFEFNKSKLSEGEEYKLNNLTSKIKTMNDISGVTIIGYADRIGTDSYNENLSQKRAKAVEEYMRKQGYLNVTVAKTRWLGESDPITQCATDMKRAALITCLHNDRRVTVEMRYQDHQ